jgi:hypothetical protein
MPWKETERVKERLDFIKAVVRHLDEDGLQVAEPLRVEWTSRADRPAVDSSDSPKGD